MYSLPLPSNIRRLLSAFFGHTTEQGAQIQIHPTPQSPLFQENTKRRSPPYRVLHNAQIRMAHARVCQLYKQLAGPRRRRVERGDRGADAAGVVVGAGKVLLRDRDFGGGGHCCVKGRGADLVMGDDWWGKGGKFGYGGRVWLFFFLHVRFRGWNE
jgi:hypothetical protein